MRIFQNWFEGRRDPALVNAGLYGAYLQGMPNLPVTGWKLPEVPETGCQNQRHLCRLAER
jgi:hypothetical protein